nr:RNA polymerase sigma factor [Kibdelosporangium phytohabitans]
MPTSSFDEFVAANRRRVEIALSARWNPRDVEDAVQEAFVLAHADWDEIRRGGSPAGWVTTTARRHLIRWSQQNQNHDTIVRNSFIDLIGTQLTPDRLDQVTPDRCRQITDRAALRQALSTLKPAYAEALALHHILDHSIEDTAEALSVPVNTAKTHVRRGRQQLREAYEALTTLPSTAGGAS